VELDTKNIKLIVLDFDGVLTDNFVYMNELDEETVRCCKSDSVAIDILKSKGVDFYVLSNEKRNYVIFRCKKMKILSRQIEGNKVDQLDFILNKFNVKMDEILFIGNDLNDLDIMKSGVLTCCPSDSAQEILDVSKIKLKTKGGYGVIRELLNLMENK